jgi:xanthosine phosphorylase
MFEVPIQEAIDYVKRHAPDFKAQVGVVTGSGLSAFVDRMEHRICIDYAEIPGVVAGDVEGHDSRLVLGEIEGVPVACLQGRLHRYEGIPYRSMQILINLLKGVGCESVIITNASGSLREEVGAGELVAINDHINLSFDSPLQGPNDSSVGPRFVSLSNTYDETMRQRMGSIAKDMGFSLHEGVYVGVAGPSFETPAEIRMFKTMGADVVGMSTIPDVHFARHCGLKIAVLAAIVNLAAGITGEELSHEDTISEGKKCAGRMIKLIVEYIKSEYGKSLS